MYQDDDCIAILYERIRSNVKRLRERKHKSQLEMALAIGHSSAGFYAKAEHGIQNKKFNIQHLCKIAQVLEVDIYEFFKDPNEVKRMQHNCAEHMV